MFVVINLKHVLNHVEVGYPDISTT